MAKEESVCSTLDDKDIRWCTARGHGDDRTRATHFVVWPTKTGASGAYRCRVHAMEFCERRGIAFPERVSLRFASMQVEGDANTIAAATRLLGAALGRSE
jgi:hypothetical protein